MEIRLAHVINIVPPGTNATLEKEQEITLRCMVNAHEHDRDPGQTQLLAMCFEDEKALAPEGVTLLPVLKRSVKDKIPDIKKRLPYLKDILALTLEHTNADYIIYTNADICVVPRFYNLVRRYIQKGHDAIVINRRRVSAAYLHNPDLELMFAETGMEHPGYDCFVFKRELFQRFILEDVCIGVPPACNDLFHNFFCFAQNPVLYSEKQLTYHIGTDLHKQWGEKHLEKANYAEMKKMFRKLRPYLDISKFPGAELPFFKRHFKWLMSPMYSYPLMLRLDLAQWRRPRKPRKKPEVKGMFQKYMEWVVRHIGFKD